MKALRVHTGQPIAPFGDPPGDAPVLGQTLAAAQGEEIRKAGFTLVDAPPQGEPYLLLSDRTWFTADALRRLAAGGPGRLRVEHEGWHSATAALQRLPAPGVYELGVVPPGGPPDLAALEPRTVDLGLRLADPPPIHPRMRHALRPLAVGPAMVHQVDHWSHILRINQLALAARGEEARIGWEQAGLLRKIGIALRILWRSRSLRRHRILAALGEVGEGATIHPTAVVELSVIGPKAEIGPHAVVRGSVIGAGAKIEEHASVNLSTVGEGATIGRYGQAVLSVVYPGAFVSQGGGYQAAVIGRGAFLAWGATALDLSFGRPVQVEMDGRLQDSGQHFLGVAVGHGAVVGNGVRLSYGVAVPNGALLVADASDLLRSGEGITPEVAMKVEGGRAVPVGRRR